VVIPFIGGMDFAGSQRPGVFVKLWKRGIAIDFNVNARHQDAIRPWKELPIDLTATDDEAFIDITTGFNRLLELARYDTAGCFEGLIAGEDDVRSVLERFWKRVPCASAHDDRVAHRGLPKMKHVGPKSPGEIAITPDGVVFSCGDNERDQHGLAPSDRNWRGQSGMGVVPDQVEVIQREIKHGRDVLVEFHGWQCTRFTGQLRIHLFEMIRVDVRVTDDVYEITWKQISALSDHHRQQGIGRDVERNSEKEVGASLIKLA
tara:strand:+ start:982 stop:1764 length:783 start_codon:yes stop_codon:yes gene_type:complete